VARKCKYNAFRLQLDALRSQHPPPKIDNEGDVETLIDTIEVKCDVNVARDELLITREASGKCLFRRLLKPLRPALCFSEVATMQDNE
jgi:hypothetical protein